MPISSLRVLWSLRQLSRWLSSFRLLPIRVAEATMDHVASRAIKSYTHTTRKSTKIGIQVVSSFPWVYIGYPCGQGQVVFPSSNFCMLWEGQAPQPIPSFSPSSTAGSSLAQHRPFAILTAKVHVFAFSQFHPQLGTREEGRRALPLANHFCQPCTCSVQCFFCPVLPGVGDLSPGAGQATAGSSVHKVLPWLPGQCSLS